MLEVVLVGWEAQWQNPILRRSVKQIGGDMKFIHARGNWWVDADRAKRADLLLIWNGMQYNMRSAVEMARRRGIPYLVFENGLFGQQQNWFWDSRGFNGESSMLCLSDVSRDDLDRLDKHRAELHGTGWRREPEGFVLVPLQVENDTQILYHTPWESMDDFIDHLAMLYPTERVVIRPHPKSSARRAPAAANQEIQQGGSFLEIAAKASVVVGLTSTCLWESLIAGVPTIALGDHPIRYHPPSSDRLLAAAARSRNFHVSTPLQIILERFNIDLGALACRAARRSHGPSASTAASA